MSKRPIPMAQMVAGLGAICDAPLQVVDFRDRQGDAL
jgi:hypothetical protein